MVEQLTLNQLVVGSSPTRGTILSASVAELVDAADSKSASSQGECGFESLHWYHFEHWVRYPSLAS